MSSLNGTKKLPGSRDEKVLTSSWDVWGKYHGKMPLNFNDGKFNRRNRLYILDSGNGFRNSMMRMVWIMDNSII